MYWYVIHTHSMLYIYSQFHTVHGFTNVSYTVTEGETMNIIFTKEVKGSTNLQPYLQGRINILPDTARTYICTLQQSFNDHGTLCFALSMLTENADFEALNGQVVSNNQRLTQISVVTIDDERVELNESVVVEFVHRFNQVYINFLEGRGEFLRNTATVVIIDNDCEFGWMCCLIILKNTNNYICSSRC